VLPVDPPEIVAARLARLVARYLGDEHGAEAIKDAPFTL
jgi:hypothetical protein